MNGALGMEQEKRTARAFLESGDWSWAEGPRGWIVTTGSGKCYEIPKHGRCTCPDSQRRCVGSELRCKHETALAHWLFAQQGRPSAESPITDALTRVESKDEIFNRIFEC